jgi:hypothetical protein
MKTFTAVACALGLALSSWTCGKGNGAGGIDSLAQMTAPVDGKEFTLRQGDSIRLTGSQSTLYFLSVPEDSRCPSGVQCIWAGNAQASLQLDTTQFSLNTTVEPREAVVAGFRFSLVQLTPRPEGSDTMPARYSATLKVTR